MIGCRFVPKKCRFKPCNAAGRMIFKDVLLMQ